MRGEVFHSLKCEERTIKSFEMLCAEVQSFNHQSATRRKFVSYSNYPQLLSGYLNPERKTFKPSPAEITSIGSHSKFCSNTP